MPLYTIKNRFTGAILFELECGSLKLAVEATKTIMAHVGCRSFSLAEGRAYWSNETHPKREKRREVLAALDYIEAVARLRGWTGEAA